MKRPFIKASALALVIFLWNPGSSMIAKGEIKRSAVEEEEQMHRETDVLKILSVLEKRIGDQRLLEKAKGKLVTLKRSELDLIASLSEQTIREKERPGLDLAFLLMTALIILA